MIPTDQETEFFIEHQQELPKWEPGLGDWCTPKDPIEPGHGLAFLIGGKSCRFYRLFSSEGTQRWALLAEHLKEDFIFLPRQGQLQAMLEERGLNWSCDYLREAKEEERYRAYCWSNRPIKGAKALVGPTPSIALGRALIEVLKEE